MIDTQKGRATPTEDFTFPETGITVKIRKVGPLLRDDIDAQLRIERPAPEPPIKKKNYGTEEEPDWIEGPDPYDPGYKDALRKWGIEHANQLGDKLLWVAVRRGIDLEITDEIREQVDEIRKDLQAVGVELDPDDKFVYVTRICVGSSESLRALHDAIFSRSRPAREEVDAIKSTFQSDVQGEGHLQVPIAIGEDQKLRRVQLDGSSSI